MANKSPLILCIDDEPELMNYFILYLKEDLNADVTFASTIERAEMKLMEDKVDFVTLDLLMPHRMYDIEMVDETPFSGLILLKNLRTGKYGTENAHVPLIILSAAGHIAMNMIKQLPAYEKTWCYSKLTMPSKIVDTIIGALK